MLEAQALRVKAEAEGAGGTRRNRYTGEGIRVTGVNQSKQARRNALCASEVISVDDSTGDTLQAAESVPESENQDRTAREPTAAPKAPITHMDGVALCMSSRSATGYLGVIKKKPDPRAKKNILGRYESRPGKSSAMWSSHDSPEEAAKAYALAVQKMLASGHPGAQGARKRLGRPQRQSPANAPLNTASAIAVQCLMLLLPQMAQSPRQPS